VRYPNSLRLIQEMQIELEVREPSPKALIAVKFCSRIPETLGLGRSHIETIPEFFRSLHLYCVLRILRVRFCLLARLTFSQEPAMWYNEISLVDISSIVIQSNTNPEELPKGFT
jgi:hypothetical protein